MWLLRSHAQSAFRILSAAALVSCLGAVGTLAAEPFDLRGIKLGMTLSEFRALPHPDGGDAKVFCQGDPDGQSLFSGIYALILSINEDQRTAGAIACGHAQFTEKYGWLGASLNVATVGTNPEYDFLPDPTRNNELTLYAIVVRSNISNWDKFREGYTGKYGKPSHVSNEPMQNGLGAKFDNSVATWENDQSTITLIQRFTRIDNTYIFYEHKRLSKEIKRRVEEKNGKPSDKL